jgi:hypothetical protein
MYSLCSWFVQSLKFCHFGPLFHQFQPSCLRHFRGNLISYFYYSDSYFPIFFNIDVNNIIESLAKLSFVFNMAIKVFLEEINFRMIGKLTQNNTWALDLKFHLDHIRSFMGTGEAEQIFRTVPAGVLQHEDDEQHGRGEYVSFQCLPVRPPHPAAVGRAPSAFHRLSTAYLRRYRRRKPLQEGEQQEDRGRGQFQQDWHGRKGGKCRAQGNVLQTADN